MIQERVNYQSSRKCSLVRTEKKLKGESGMFGKGGKKKIEQIKNNINLNSLLTSVLWVSLNFKHYFTSLYKN